MRNASNIATNATDFATISVERKTASTATSFKTVNSGTGQALDEMLVTIEYTATG